MELSEDVRKFLRDFGIDPEEYLKICRTHRPVPDRNPNGKKKAKSAQDLTPKELCITKFAAQFLARYGDYVWFELRDKFVKHDHLFHCEFFDWLVDSYKQVLHGYRYSLSDYGGRPGKPLIERFFCCPPVEKLEDGVEETPADTAMIDFEAFVSGVDSFARLDCRDYSAKMPRSKGISQAHQALETPGYASETSILSDAVTIPLVELDIIKLTAQFVARYGQSFLRALMMRVVMNPQFEFLFFNPHSRGEFMDQTKSRCDIFDALSIRYDGLVKKSNNACTASSLVEEFFSILQLDKLEQGVETAITDLHAFLAGLDYFTYAEDYNTCLLPPPQRLSVLMNRLPQITEYPTRHPFLYTCTSLQPQRILSNHMPTFRFPEKGITLKDLGIIKLRGMFEARYGDPFLRALDGTKSCPLLFEFFQRSDSRVEVYLTYLKVLKFIKKKPKKSDTCARHVKWFLDHFQFEKGMETPMVDLHAFMGAIDYFAYADVASHAAIMPQRESLSMILSRLTKKQPDILVHHPPVGCVQPDLDPQHPPLKSTHYIGWVYLMELGIMKLTALFVVRYGMYFCWDLVKQVAEKPQFDFMKPTDSRFMRYCRIVDAYERVLKPYDDDMACREKPLKTGTIVDNFLKLLNLEELEKGANTAMIDLHSLFCAVDYFVMLEDGDHCSFPPRWLMLCWRTSPMGTLHPFISRLFWPKDDETSVSLKRRMSPLPPEEPEPKRQKVRRGGY